MIHKTMQLFRRLATFGALAAFVVVIPFAAAKAQVTEQQYIAEREAIAAILTSKYNAALARNAREVLSSIELEDDQATKALAPKLKAVIGIDIPGMSPKDRINPETLLPGSMESGRLDSLPYKGPNGIRLHVTTEGIAAHWLSNWQRENKKEKNPIIIPKTLTAALQSHNFLTAATDDDAHVHISAKLPLKKREEAKFALAMLEGRSQDGPVTDPEAIMVVAIQGGLIFIAEAPLKKRLGLVKPCIAHLANATPGCFETYAPRVPGYADAVKQAQELYDSFPLRSASQ